MSSQWADEPFKLISTPAYEQKNTTSDEQDSYTQAASIMVLNHNMILRGLNSIFLQAPSIDESEVQNFLSYAQCWCRVLRDHHDVEEEYLFPEIERYTNDKKFVQANVEQHDAFLEPLATMETYLKQKMNDPTSYSGQAFCNMISSFAPILQKHLEEEIPSLIELKEYRNALPIAKLMQETGNKAAAASDKLTSGIFFVLNIDMDFEDGRWKSWPPIPTPIRLGPMKAMMWWHNSWWKYASCDIHGKKKNLLAF